MNKIGLQILNTLTFILLLLAYISNARIIEIGNNLNTNLTYFIFPLIFLILIIINNFYSHQEAKKTIKSSSISLIIFILLIMILNLIPSNLETIESELLFKNLFTPNNIAILNFKIYYPNLLYLGTYITLSFITSYIMIAIYNVIKKETKEFIAYYLAEFISLILFVIILTSIDSSLINKLTMKDTIYNLTSGFIVIIALSIITLIINSIINIFKKSNQN